MGIKLTNSGSRPPVRGLIFDLDGTLVDSALDFDAMRLEMGIEPGQSILEALDRMPPSQANHCRAILDRHEMEGVERCQPMPGVSDMLTLVQEKGWRRAVLTRNSREMSLATLDKLGFEFDPIVTRDDAPPKPDPAAVWRICEYWGISPPEAAVVGDHRFDLRAGRRAGARTVLYQGKRRLAEVIDRDLADFVVESFCDTERFFAWLAESA